MPFLRSSHRSLPRLLAHADWGCQSGKRQMAVAVHGDGNYHLLPPEPVGNLRELPGRLMDKAGKGEMVLLGVDFPIGLPAAYAARAGISDFLEALPQFGSGEWIDFYEVAETAGQVSLHRPFYPRRPGGCLRAQLIGGLGLPGPSDLYRSCERATADRPAASPLFWTLGAKQVGKAAICGWRDLLARGLPDPSIKLAIWPFAGPLRQLIRERMFVVAETYPAEAYRSLGFPPTGWSKRRAADRRARAVEMLTWAAQRPVVFDERLGGCLTAGFGETPQGEDQFDAVVGLLMMVDVVLNYRSEGTPADDAVRRIEGWIFGQQPRLPT